MIGVPFTSTTRAPIRAHCGSVLVAVCSLTPTGSPPRTRSRARNASPGTMPLTS